MSWNDYWDLTFTYTTPHTKGTEDYTSIKSTLTSVNKRLNS